MSAGGVNRIVTDGKETARETLKVTGGRCLMPDCQEKEGRSLTTYT